MVDLSELAQLELGLRQALISESSRNQLLSGSTSSLVDDIQNAKWTQLVKNERFKDFWQRIRDTGSLKELQKILDGLTHLEDTSAHLEAFALGVACLQLFVQANWAGWRGDEALQACVNVHDSLKSEIDEALSVDGEVIRSVARHPLLLLISKNIFTDANIYHKNWTFQWWRLRTQMVHQACLSDRCDTFYRTCTALIENIENHPEWKEFSSEGQFYVHFYLEKGLLYTSYFDVTTFRECVESCAKKVGLEITETGAMGKRTRYQTRDLAQLTIQVESKSESKPGEFHHGDTSSKAIGFPRDVKLQDEVRLEKIEFTEKRENGADLNLLEQCIMMAMFMTKQRSQPKDDLTYEETMPYLIEILSSGASCWSLQMHALLQRSKLESNSKRTVERAILQIEALVDSLNDTDVSINHEQRLPFIYLSGLPPFWEIEHILCSALQAIGSLKTALDIALRIELWNEVIDCYQNLGQRHKAAEIIQQELAKKETPLLCCMMGDATGDLSWYEKALELSNNRNARAFRSMGVHFYFKKEYEKAAEYFKKSVDLNPFQPKTLLRLGYTAIQIENWELAAQIYRQYCNYEPDNFEAWNNLANAYIKIGNKARAWKVLQEALKCDYDNWKIWDNIMVVSTDCAHYEEVIRAYNRILDLKKDHVDTEVLKILVHSIVNDSPDNYGRPSGRLTERAQKLFGKLTSQVINNSMVWELYSDLHSKQGDPVKVCQYLQKSFAAFSQQRHWAIEEDKCRDGMRLGIKYAECALALKNELDESRKKEAEQQLVGCKYSLMSVQFLIEKHQTDFITEEIREALKEPFREYSQVIDKVSNSIGT